MKLRNILLQTLFLSKLKFSDLNLIFIHIYRIHKQFSWLPSINLKFSLPVNLYKVKKFLKREESFNIFIKLYNQTEQIFNSAMKPI